MSMTAVSVWPEAGTRRLRGPSRSVTRCAGPGCRVLPADYARQVGVSMVRLIFAQIFQFGALGKRIRSPAASMTVSIQGLG